MRLGYSPWLHLGAYHACVRMIRADDCGDGQATTREGTMIDTCDALGIQRSAAGSELAFNHSRADIR